MIEAGEVGAVFTVVDEASVILQRLARQFKELDALVLNTKKSLAGFGKTLGLDKLAADTAAISRELTTIGTTADASVARANAAFGKMDASVDASIAQISKLKAEMASLGRIPGTGRFLPGGGGGGGGGGSIRNGPHFGAESPSFNTPAGRIRTEGGNIWEALGVYAVLDTIKNIVTAGGELETQKKLLHDLLGNREQSGDVDGAVKAAIAYSTDANSGIIGSTPASNLAGLREIYPFMPNLSAAIKELPSLMQAAKLLEELTHGQKKAETQLPILAKALENLGGGIDPETHELSPERMDKAVNEAVKTIIAGGGVIDANALLGFAKQAGGMGRITTDLGTMFDNIITSVLDMGGNRSGTALAALGRQFLGDVMSPQKAEELESLGILPKGGWHKAGAGIAMNPGQKMLGEDEIKDPEKGIAAWVRDVWGPAVMRKLGPNATVADVMQESYKDFSTSTAQRLGLLFLANSAQVERDKLIRNSVDPKGAYQGMVAYDLAANANNLSAAIKGLGEVLGGPSTDVAISGLQTLTSAIHGLTDAASISPNADKTILGTALGGALAGAVGWISKFFGGPGVGDVLGALGKTASAPLAITAIGTLTSPEEKAASDALIAKQAADHPGDPWWREKETWGRLFGGGGGSADAANAKALGAAIPPPQVKVDSKTDVSVTLDGAAIAAKVVSKMTSQMRSVNGTNTIDSGAHWSPPDMGK